MAGQHERENKEEKPNGAAVEKKDGEGPDNIVVSHHRPGFCYS